MSQILDFCLLQGARRLEQNPCAFRLPQYEFKFQSIELKNLLLSLDAKKINIATQQFEKNPDREAKYLFTNEGFVNYDIVAISIYAVVVIAETMRSALMSVDDGQYEAGYSVGLTRWQTLRRVVLPQAFPFAVPALCNNFIGLIKGSSIVYLITVVDVMNGALTSA